MSQGDHPILAILQRTEQADLLGMTDPLKDRIDIGTSPRLRFGSAH
jgi:hypothetical protein